MLALATTLINNTRNYTNNSSKYQRAYESIIFISLSKLYIHESLNAYPIKNFKNYKIKLLLTG